MNDKGGRDIHILTKKAGKQMMKFDLSTEKMINDDQIMIKLHDSLEIDPDSALFRRVVNEYRMSVDHVPGDHLNIQTNGKKFKSFVIAKTGNNNERKIEINGKQLASGDYTLTDNSFKTKITLQNGDWLEPKVTWEGALLKSSATGSKRNFDIDLSWKATKPDWDFSTPESLKIDINAKGESPRWGNWMLSRDASFKVE